MELRKENFENFDFDWLCETEGRQPEVQYFAEGDQTTALRIIASMNGEELRAFRPNAHNFPLIYFATSRTSWYNENSVAKEAKTVKNDEDGVRKFMKNIENFMAKTNLPGAMSDALKYDKPVLTVLTNGNVKQRLVSSGTELKIFGEPVDVSVVNLSDFSAVQILKRVDRTREPLQELRKFQ